MRVSVAICTWNRAVLLAQTLEQMTRLSVPADVDWEVAVVNNNCTDATDRVIADFAGRLPLKRLFEATPGHSHARNRAVREVKGDLLLWTDDDVLVDRNWLVEYVAAFNADPAAAYFAGPVEPWFESQPPRWMRRHLRELLGVIVCVDNGPEMRRMKPGEGLFGANMAVRRDIASKFLFNERLGRVRDTLVGGDDTDFVRRLTDSGHCGLWVPRAKVQHFVPRSRVTRAYVKRWFRDAGRTAVRSSPLADAPSLGGVPRWVLREYLQELATACFWMPTGNSRWFGAYRRALMLSGVIQESRAARSPGNRVTPAPTNPSLPSS